MLFIIQHSFGAIDTVSFFPSKQVPTSILSTGRVGTNRDLLGSDGEFFGTDPVGLEVDIASGRGREMTLDENGFCLYPHVRNSRKCTCTFRIIFSMCQFRTMIVLRPGITLIIMTTIKSSMSITQNARLYWCNKIYLQRLLGCITFHHCRLLESIIFDLKVLKFLTRPQRH